MIDVLYSQTGKTDAADSDIAPSVTNNTTHLPGQKDKYQ